MYQANHMLITALDFKSLKSSSFTFHQTIGPGKRRDIFCTDSIFFEHQELHIWEHICLPHSLLKLKDLSKHLYNKL